MKVTAKIRTKYVLQTTKNELKEKWGDLPLPFPFEDPLYIQSTKDGIVNWEKNSVYQSHEIEDNFKIVTNQTQKVKHAK